MKGNRNYIINCLLSSVYLLSQITRNRGTHLWLLKDATWLLAAGMQTVETVFSHPHRIGSGGSLSHADCSTGHLSRHGDDLGAQLTNPLGFTTVRLSVEESSANAIQVWMCRSMMKILVVGGRIHCYSEGWGPAVQRSTRLWSGHWDLWSYMMHFWTKDSCQLQKEGEMPSFLNGGGIIFW